MDSNNKRRFSIVTKKHIPVEQAKKFVAISKKGFVPYNRGKVNQDSYFCDYNFDKNANCKLFGVADGHGEFGHLVSSLVARKIPKYLRGFDYINNTEQAIHSACDKMVSTLRKSNIDTTFSDTTLVFSLIVNDIVYTANIGDSRAIIVQQSEDGTLACKALSIDHKCEIPEEKERILAKGGRVATLPCPNGEDSGPLRVWLADIDVPGLAMSRSLGDDVAHSVGVSNECEIIIHKLDMAKDAFLILGSDGIWEFLSNEDAANIVSRKLPDLREAALKLCKEAMGKWRDNEEVIDDITAIIYNLSTEEKTNGAELERLVEQREDTNDDDEQLS